MNHNSVLHGSHVQTDQPKPYINEGLDLNGPGQQTVDQFKRHCLKKKVFEVSLYIMLSVSSHKFFYCHKTENKCTASYL